VENQNRPLAIPKFIYFTLIEHKDILENKYGLRKFSDIINFLLFAYVEFYKNNNPTFSWVEKINTIELPKSDTITKGFTITKKNYDLVEYVKNNTSDSFITFIRNGLYCLLTTIIPKEKLEELISENEIIKDTTKSVDEDKDKKEIIKQTNIEPREEINTKEEMQNLAILPSSPEQIDETTDEIIMEQINSSEQLPKDTKAKCSILDTLQTLDIYETDKITINKIEMSNNNQNILNLNTLEEVLNNQETFLNLTEEKDANLLDNINKINNNCKTFLSFVLQNTQTTNKNITLDTLLNTYQYIFLNIDNKNILDIKQVFETILQKNKFFIDIVNRISDDLLYIISSLTLTAILTNLREIDEIIEKTTQQKIQTKNYISFIDNLIVLNITKLQKDTNCSKEDINKIIDIFNEKFILSCINLI
jgi:hypothetical protein